MSGDIVERAECAVSIVGAGMVSASLVTDLVAEVKRLRSSTIRAQVSEFHRAFGQAIGDKPAVPSDDVVRLRARLITEEYLEMMGAMFGTDWDGHVRGGDTITSALRDAVNGETVRVDLPELVDAWGDLDYVVEGSRLAFGVNGEPVAAEIQRSNLSKLGADGKPIRRDDGKTLKGPNYSPPDVVGVLKAQGWTL